PVQPTTAGTTMIGGVNTWTGGAYSGQPVASTPANAGDLTPYLRTPGLTDPTGRVAPSIAPSTPSAIASHAYSGLGSPVGPSAPLPDQNFVAPWGSQAAGFFNDPRLRDVVARGYNSNPNVPLFPQ